MRSVYWTGDEVTDPGEPALLNRVDHVFAVSSTALVLKQRYVGERAVEMPMAIDPEPFFAARQNNQIPMELLDLPRPIFGFGGSLTWRIDWRLLRAITDRGVGTIVLVGPINDRQAERGLAELLASGSAVWLGHRDAQQAPHYLAAFDVGLIPYGHNAFNDGSNPVKFYEYLAAGVPVVSTALPALSGFGEVATFADEPEGFASAAVAAALSAGASVDVARRQELAKQHSYHALVSRVDAHLHSTDRNRVSTDMVLERP